MLIILATQEAEIRRIGVRNHETLSQKHQYKKGLVEWFKV
jgi:hypothetical protein